MDRGDWCECAGCRDWHRRLRERQLGPKRIDPGKVDVHSLSNEWLFAPDPDNTGLKDRWYDASFDDRKWSAIRSDKGTGWEHQYKGDYGAGLGWYRQRWKVPAKAGRRKRLYLFFGAVDEEAWVYINGKQAFEHTQASTGMNPDVLWKKPFAFEVTKFIRPGAENTIAVRVLNLSGMGGVYRPAHLLATDGPINTAQMKQALNMPVEGFLWPHGVLWLDFALRVQALLADETDRPRISVMAYGYTADPPKRPVMHKDLNVFYADLMTSQFHALDDPDNLYNKAFRRRLEAWLKSAESVYVWLYHVNFADSWYLIHPNMHAFADNFRYLRKAGVKGIFAQGNQMAWWGHRFAGEMNELRAYLLARLLWNPDLDWRRERRDFCTAYYGEKAGQVIEQYLDDLTAEFVKQDVQGLTSVMGREAFSWIKPEMYSRWYEYMKKAESLADDDKHRKLVRIARLPIQFTEAFYQKDPAKRKSLLQAFLNNARGLGAASIISENCAFTTWASREGLK